MSEITEAALRTYVDEKFSEMNRSISMLKEQMVTVIQSLEIEVKKAYNKDITIAQLRAEISTLEKMLDKYISVSSELTNVKKFKTTNEETHDHCNSKHATPKTFQFGANPHLATSTNFTVPHAHPLTTFLPMKVPFDNKT